MALIFPNEEMKMRKCCWRLFGSKFSREAVPPSCPPEQLAATDYLLVHSSSNRGYNILIEVDTVLL